MKDNFKVYYNDYSVDPKYVDDLYFLQVELLKLQKYIYENKRRMVILFEGRDTAGKGSAIFRFTQFLNPRTLKIVALGKPTKNEKGQWFFQRYLKRLPNPGEMVFFDRSWYNRAVVEPVMNFCTTEQYDRFMNQVGPVENMLIENGIIVVKFWFSIKAEEQKDRIKERLESPLKQWKVSPVDLVAQEKWESFTHYKNEMFRLTHRAENPWVIVRGESREHARIQAMKYILALVDYDDKSKELTKADSQFVFPWKEMG